jgi:DNA replication protein DnaC
MLVNHSHERLIALRLTGMAKAFDDQLRQPDIDALAFEQRLGLMIDREITERDNRRLVTRLKFASLRQTAIIEDIDLRTPRGIDRAFLAKLVDAIGSAASTTSSSPEQQEPARVGSLAHSATRPAATIVPSSIIACRGCSKRSRSRAASDAVPRLLKMLSRVELLILDDWGLAPLTSEQRRDLLEIRR